MDYQKAERICEVLQKDLNESLAGWQPSEIEHVLGAVRLMWKRHLAMLCLLVLYGQDNEGFIVTLTYPDGDSRHFFRDISSQTGDRVVKTVVAQACAYDAVNG